jgi:hypothetical protein
VSGRSAGEFRVLMVDEWCETDAQAIAVARLSTPPGARVKLARWLTPQRLRFDATLSYEVCSPSASPNRFRFRSNGAGGRAQSGDASALLDSPGSDSELDAGGAIALRESRLSAPGGVARDGRS